MHRLILITSLVTLLSSPVQAGTVTRVTVSGTLDTVFVSPLSSLDIQAGDSYMAIIEYEPDAAEVVTPPESPHLASGAFSFGAGRHAAMVTIGEYVFVFEDNFARILHYERSGGRINDLFSIDVSSSDPAPEFPGADTGRITFSAESSSVGPSLFAPSFDTTAGPVSDAVDIDFGAVAYTDFSFRGYTPNFSSIVFILGDRDPTFALDGDEQPVPQRSSSFGAVKALYAN